MGIYLQAAPNGEPYAAVVWNPGSQVNFEVALRRQSVEAEWFPIPGSQACLLINSRKRDAVQIALHSLAGIRVGPRGGAGKNIGCFDDPDTGQSCDFTFGMKTIAWHRGK